MRSAPRGVFKQRPEGEPVRGKALVFALLSISLMGTAACTPTKPKEDPIEAVAGILDKSNFLTTAFTYRGTMDAKPTPGQVADFISATDAMTRWNEYLKSRGGNTIPWLTRFLNATSDVATATTACADRNNMGSGPDPTVTAVKSDPFFCPNDNQGTRYIPVESVQQRWVNAGRDRATMQAVMYVWLAAVWGDAYMSDVYAYARDKMHMSAFPDPTKTLTDQYLTGLSFGYCIAGEIAKGAGLDGTAVKSTLAVLFGNDTGMPMVKFKEALVAGYDSSRTGDCVRQYWPRGSS